MSDTVESVRVSLGRVLDWVYLISMGGIIGIALVGGILWMGQLIPPSDFTSSQVFGFVMVLAGWIVFQITLTTYRASRR